MALRYVVVLRTEDHHRVFGTYKDAERAEAFAAKINDELERREDAEFAAWQERQKSGEGRYSYGSPIDMAPDGYGRAGVLIIHTPRYREALAFALTGDPNPALARKAVS